VKPLILHIGRTSLRAELPGRRWSAVAEYRCAEDLSEVVAQLVEEIPGRSRGREVLLQVEPPLAQVRRLRDLPEVGSKDLRSLIAIQSGQFFRKNGHPLITDAVWLRKRGAAREALAAAVEEPLVEALMAASADVGLHVSRASPAGPGGLSKLSLMPAGARVVRNAAARAGLRRLAMATLAVWVLVGTCYPILLRRELRRVESQRSALSGAVEALSGLRREVRQAQQMLDVMAEANRGRGRAFLLSALLSSALPDSAYLESMQVRSDGSGLVAGRAARAGDVLASLSKLDAIVAPRPEGSILRESAAGRAWEGFTVRFGGSNP